MLPLYVYLRRKRIRVKHAVIVLVLFILLIQLLLKLRNKSHHRLVKREAVTPRTCVALFLVLHFRVPHEIFISTSSRLAIKDKLASYTNTSEDQIFLDDKITHNGLPQSMQNQSFYMRGSSDSDGKCGYVWGFDSQNREVLYDTCAEANLNNSWKFCKLPHDIMTKVSSENFADIDKYCRPNLAAAWPLGNISKCIADSSNDAAKWVQFARSLDNDLMKDKKSQIIGHPINAWQVLGLVVEYDEDLFHSGFNLISTTEASTEKTSTSQIAIEVFKKSETVTPTEAGDTSVPALLSTSSMASTASETQLVTSVLHTVEETSTEHLQNVISTPAYHVTTENEVSVVTTEESEQESYTFNQQAYMEKIRKIYPDFFDQATKTDISALPTSSKGNKVKHNDEEDMTSGIEPDVGYTPPIFQLSASVLPQPLTNDDSTTSANDTIKDLFSLQHIIHKIYGILLDNFPQPLSSLLSKIHNATDHTHVSLPQQYYGNENSLERNDRPASSQISTGSENHHNGVEPGHSIGSSIEGATATHPSSVTSKLSSQSIDRTTRFPTTTTAKSDHIHDHVEHFTSPTITGEDEAGLYSGDSFIDPLRSNIDMSKTTTHILGAGNDNEMQSVDVRYVHPTSPNPLKSEVQTQDSRLQEVGDPVLSTPEKFGTVTLLTSNYGTGYFSTTSKPVQATTTDNTDVVVSQDLSFTVDADFPSLSSSSTKLNLDSTLKSTTELYNDNAHDSSFTTESDQTVTSSSKLNSIRTSKSSTNLEDDKSNMQVHLTTSDIIQKSSSTPGLPTSTSDRLTSKTTLSRFSTEDVIVEVVETTSLNVGGEYKPTPASSASEESISDQSYTESLHSAGHVMHTATQQMNNTNRSITDSETSIITNVPPHSKDPGNAQYRTDPLATESMRDRFNPTVETAYTTPSSELAGESITNLDAAVSSSQTMKPIIIHEITLPSVDESTMISPNAYSTVSIFDTPDSFTTLSKSKDITSSSTTYGVYTVPNDRVSRLPIEVTTLDEGSIPMTSVSLPSDNLETSVSTTAGSDLVAVYKETTVTKTNIDADLSGLPVSDYSIGGIMYDDTTITINATDGMESSESGTLSTGNPSTISHLEEEESTGSGKIPLTGVYLFTASEDIENNLHTSTLLPSTVQSTTNDELPNATPTFISLVSNESPKEFLQINYEVSTTTKDTTGNVVSTTSSTLNSQHYTTTSSFKSDVGPIGSTVVNGHDATEHQDPSIGSAITKTDFESTLSTPTEITEKLRYETPSSFASKLHPKIEDSTKYNVDDMISSMSVKIKPTHAGFGVEFTQTSKGSAMEKVTASTGSFPQLDAQDGMHSTKSSIPSETVDQDMVQGVTSRPTKDLTSSVLFTEDFERSKQLVTQTLAITASFQPESTTTTLVNKILDIPTGHSEHRHHSTLSPTSSGIPDRTSLETPVDAGSTIKLSNDAAVSDLKSNPQFNPISTTRYDMLTTLLPEITEHETGHGVTFDQGKHVATETITSIADSGDSTSQVLDTFNAVEIILNENDFTPQPSFESSTSHSIALISTPPLTINPAVDHLHSTLLHTPSNIGFNGSPQGTNTNPTLDHSSIETTESKKGKYSYPEENTQSTPTAYHGTYSMPDDMSTEASAEEVDFISVHTSTEAAEFGFFTTSPTLTVSLMEKQGAKISSTLPDSSDNPKTSIDSDVSEEDSSTMPPVTHSATKQDSSKPTSKVEEDNIASSLPNIGTTFKTPRAFSQPNRIKLPTTSYPTIYINISPTDTLTESLATRYVVETGNSITTDTSAVISTATEVPVTFVTAPDIHHQHAVLKTPETTLSVPTFSEGETSYDTTLEPKTTLSHTLSFANDGNRFTDQTLQSLSVTPGHILPTTMSPVSSHDTVDLSVETISHITVEQPSSTVQKTAGNPTASSHLLVTTTSIVLPSTSSDFTTETSVRNPILGSTIKNSVFSSVSTQESMSDVSSKPSKPNVLPMTSSVETDFILTEEISIEKHRPTTKYSGKESMLTFCLL